MLILGGRNNELCNLRFETVEPLLISRKCFAQYLFPYLPITHSGNRYEFGYRSIKMGNVTFSSASSEMFAYLHTAKPYIGVPGEFLKAIAQNLNAKVTYSCKFCFSFIALNVKFCSFFDTKIF